MANVDPKSANTAGGQRGGPKKKGSLGMRLTVLLASLPMVYVMWPTVILLGSTMAPTLVAYLFDRTRGKYMAITIGLLNGCGSLPALVRLWQLEQTQDTSFEILRDTMTWVEAWGGAFVGIMLFIGMAPIIHNFYTLTTAGRIHGLRRKQRALIKEWGPEVAAGFDEEFAQEVSEEDESEDEAEPEQASGEAA